MFAKNEKKTEEELSTISNIIGRESTLDGSIASAGNIRVEGKGLGNVKAKAKFVLGDDGEVEGDVVARTAEVAGRIDGNIEISEVLVLKPSASIKGDILTNQLVIEPGATFNGACKMGHLASEIKIELPERESKKIFKRA